MQPSAEALAAYANDLQTNFLDQPVASFVTRTGAHAIALDGLGEVLSLGDLVERARTAVIGVLSEQGAS